MRHSVGRGNHGDGEAEARGHDPARRGGRGGRAGEFCLGLAQALHGQSGVWALAADTDGIDGVEDNAGACVAPETLARAQALGMKIEQYLDRNDAYGYFDKLHDLVFPGPPTPTSTTFARSWCFESLRRACAMKRRTFLFQLASPLGAAAAMAQPAAAARPVFKSIPSSGEELPVVGLGTWITFNVGNDPPARANCAEVMRNFFAAAAG